MAIKKRVWSATLAVTVTAALLSLPATSPAAAAPTIETGQPVAGEVGAVTLITGDRVTLSGDGQVSVAQHPSREDRDDIGYTTYQVRGDTYVLPTDASPLVADGLVDQELFNVSALIRYEYDDGSRDDLPLLVSRRADLRTAARDRLAAAGVRVTGELGPAGAYTARADHADLAGFSSSRRSPSPPTSSSVPAARSGCRCRRGSTGSSTITPKGTSAGSPSCGSGRRVRTGTST